VEIRPNEVRELLEEFEMLGISEGALADILRVRVMLVWKWKIGQASIPEKHTRKIYTALHYLRVR